MNVIAAARAEGLPERRLALLRELEKKLLWLSAWTIHHANHIRPNRDGLKVGGHQASCASIISVMAALYFEVLRPQDRIAVKPHAGPVFHAINVPVRPAEPREAGGVAPARRRAILSEPGEGRRRGRFLHRLGRPRRGDDHVQRADAGLRAPARAWRARGCRPAATSRSRATPSSTRATSTRRCWRAGSTTSAMSGGSSTTTARASTACVPDRLFGRFEGLFRDMGWNVVTMKYGRKLQAAFAREGGEALRALDRRLPQQPLFGAHLPGRRRVAAGAARRSRPLARHARDHRPADRRRTRRPDDQSRRPRHRDDHRDAARRRGRRRPADLLHRLHHQGHGPALRRPQGQPCRADDPGADGGVPGARCASAPATNGTCSRAWTCPPTRCSAFLDACPFAHAADAARAAAVGARGAVPARLPMPKLAGRKMSTQAGFGDILAEIGRGQGELRELAAAHRDHRPGRDGLHQPRPLGEPPRHVRPAHPQRRVPRRQARQRAALGHEAERPAHRAGHRRAESVPAARRGRPAPRP